MAQVNLTILHVSPDRHAEWREFPGMRAELERWGLLPMNSRRSDVAKLGIHVRKVQAVHPDPIESVTSYLAEHVTDLIVLAIDQSNGCLPWLSKSVAVPVAVSEKVQVPPAAMLAPVSVMVVAVDVSVPPH